MDKRLSLFSIYEEGDAFTIVEDHNKDRCWALTTAVWANFPDTRIDMEMVYDTVSGKYVGLVVRHSL